MPARRAFRGDGEPSVRARKRGATEAQGRAHARVCVRVLVCLRLLETQSYLEARRCATSATPSRRSTFGGTPRVSANASATASRCRRPIRPRCLQAAGLRQTRPFAGNDVAIPAVAAIAAAAAAGFGACVVCVRVCVCVCAVCCISPLVSVPFCTFAQQSLCRSRQQASRTLQRTMEPRTTPRHTTRLTTDTPPTDVNTLHCTALQRSAGARPGRGTARPHRRTQPHSQCLTTPHRTAQHPVATAPARATTGSEPVARHTHDTVTKAVAHSQSHLQTDSETRTAALLAPAMLCYAMLCYAHQELAQ